MKVLVALLVVGAVLAVALADSDRSPVSSHSGQAGSECDPNYVGACLDPNSPDYDCRGGEGNGPDYSGEVTVVGYDHYGLDRGGDGEGCEGR